MNFETLKQLFIQQAQIKVSELAYGIVETADTSSLQSRPMKEDIQLAIELVDVINMVDSADILSYNVSEIELRQIIDYYFGAELFPFDVHEVNPFKRFDILPTISKDTVTYELPNGIGFLQRDAFGKLLFVPMESDVTNVRVIENIIETPPETLDQEFIYVYQKTLESGQGIPSLCLYYKSSVLDIDTKIDKPTGDGSKILHDDGIWRTLPNVDEMKDKADVELPNGYLMDDAMYAILSELAYPYAEPSIVFNSMEGAPKLILGREYANETIEFTFRVTNVSSITSVGATTNLGDVTINNIGEGYTKVSITINSLEVVALTAFKLTISYTDTKGTTRTTSVSIPIYFEVHFSTGLSLDETLLYQMEAYSTHTISLLKGFKAESANESGEPEYKFLYVPSLGVHNGIDIRSSVDPDTKHSMGMSVGGVTTEVTKKITIESIEYSIFATLNKYASTVGVEVH